MKPEKGFTSFVQFQNEFKLVFCQFLAMGIDSDCL